MFKRIEIKHFKSVSRLDLELGRVTVLIGSNGSGKSNILEALAFAAGACAGKLDNEFLLSRGVRTTDPSFVGSVFQHPESPDVAVHRQDGQTMDFQFFSSIEDGYPVWRALPRNFDMDAPTADELAAVEEDSPDVLSILAQSIAGHGDANPLESEDHHRLAVRVLAALVKQMSRARSTELAKYLIFAPDAATLRNGGKENQVFPLGTRGDGLMRLVYTVSKDEDSGRWQDIVETLRTLEWFSDLEVLPPGMGAEERLAIQDRFIAGERRFDQRVANEGFLFLLFYATLFVAKQTPPFFAIDNIDSSLNPKACSRLMERLTELAVRYDKQVILTTHNPALLDGLDLHDDEQRLYATARKRDGSTKITRVHAPEPVGDSPPLRLSEAFTRGLIGGLPQNF